MRVNKFVANALGISRRQADRLIDSGEIKVDGQVARLGQAIGPQSSVSRGQHRLNSTRHSYIMLNKPVGYVCSRRGQSAPTVYELLPDELKHLQPVGRLDKDTSGLLLLTNDGDFAHQLTHPKFAKTKVYRLQLVSALSPDDFNRLADGIKLDDGVSRLEVVEDSAPNTYQVTMSEGRNRQIRRTFSQLGYNLASLHRFKFGAYDLGDLPSGHYLAVAKHD